METKNAELQQMVEEKEREKESNQQTIDRANARIRQLRSQLEDAEADRDRFNKQAKDERRRANEAADLNETLSKDVSILRQRETAARRTPGLIGHRESRRYGSSTSLARDEFRGSALTNEMSPSDRPASRLTSGTGSQLGNTDEDRDSVRN